MVQFQFMLLKVFLMVAKVNLGGLATMLTKRQLYVSVWELYRSHVRYCKVRTVLLPRYSYFYSSITSILTSSHRDHNHDRYECESDCDWRRVPCKSSQQPAAVPVVVTIGTCNSTSTQAHNINNIETAVCRWPQTKMSMAAC